MATKARTQEKRSIKNVVMTNKHHMAYMGPWVAISFGLITLIYVLILYHLYTVSNSELAPPVMGFVVGATIVVGILAALVSFYGILTAHRIAGVHIKICAVLNRVKEGDLDTRVRFRSYDKLEEVEDAFNGMMEALQTRIERAEGGKSSESESS